MFGLPSWTTIVGSLMILGAVSGYSYYSGRVSGDTACRVALSAQNAADLVIQASFAAKKYGELEKRFELANLEAKKASVKLTESQNEITRLTFTVQQVIAKSIPDGTTCRVPLPVLRSLNRLRFGPPPADVGPSSASAVRAASGP